MKRPAIFFDRDNTLIINDGYLGDPAGVKLAPGAAEAVAKARSLGFAIVVISNQSGVARGLFSEDAVQAVNQRMGELLLADNSKALIDRHEYCPYHPQAVLEQYRRDSELRKPKPGMILRAAEIFDIDLPASWVIGDAPRDMEAGQAAGCETILLNDPALPISPATGDSPRVKPYATVASLVEAVDAIEAAIGVDLPIEPVLARESSESRLSVEDQNESSGEPSDPVQDSDRFGESMLAEPSAAESAGGVDTQAHSTEHSTDVIEGDNDSLAQPAESSIEQPAMSNVEQPPVSLAEGCESNPQSNEPTATIAEQPYTPEGFVQHVPHNEAVGFVAVHRRTALKSKIEAAGMASRSSQLDAANEEPETVDLQSTPSAPKSPSQSHPSTGVASPPQVSTVDLSRLEDKLQKLIDLLKPRPQPVLSNVDQPPRDFSVSKLLAGITQSLALAAAISTFIMKSESTAQMSMLVAIYLQILTISLMVMGRDR